MKILLYSFLLSATLLGCKNEEATKAYVPTVLTANERFNEYQKSVEDSLVLVKYENKDKGVEGLKELFSVKFRDSIIGIQADAANPAALSSKFGFAQYVNTQKTCLLVQVADSSGITPRCYLIALKDGLPKIMSLYRPSNGAEDSRFTKGVIKAGNSGYLVNNDFFVANVNARVYLIKRQNPEQRIPGIYMVNSPDKSTLVFVINSSFYEVNYPTGEVLTLPVDKEAPKETGALFNWIQSNYIWKKNAKGISFLTKRPDDDRIVDISEFK